MGTGDCGLTGVRAADGTLDAAGKRFVQRPLDDALRRRATRPTRGANCVTRAHARRSEQRCALDARGSMTFHPGKNIRS